MASKNSVGLIGLSTITNFDQGDKKTIVDVQREESCKDLNILCELETLSYIIGWCIFTYHAWEMLNALDKLVWEVLKRLDFGLQFASL